ncbi:hypothetical protein BH09MYX1_BH09MYX1_37900 [soil metagenome]
MVFKRLAFVVVLAFSNVIATVAAAAPPADSAADSADLQRARELFKEGTELAKKTQWAEALQAFESSATLRHHAITTYNIGVCQRALGQYTQAREALQKSLDESAAHAGELPQSLAAEAKGYLAEIDGLLVHLDVTVTPADAKVVVDGRPLRVQGATEPPTLVAGVAAPGGGTTLPASHVTVVLGPGTHLFTLARTGFADVVLNKSYRPGEKAVLALSADALPATIRVSSNLDGSTVSLNGLDVGMAPVELTRPGGTYSLLVRREGYVEYKTTVKADPGAALKLSAELTPEGTPITKRWWFWTGAGVIVVAAVLVTFFATRPSAERPPIDGGGLNWALQVP